MSIFYAEKLVILIVIEANVVRDNIFLGHFHIKSNKVIAGSCGWELSNIFNVLLRESLREPQCTASNCSGTNTLGNYFCSQP